MFYCGFSGDFCGQSNTDDVHPSIDTVILAFANTKPDGSIIVDDLFFPVALTAQWKAQGKKVLISVGGQNGVWSYVFASNASISAFVASIDSIIRKYNLDGIDLDIEAYEAPPRVVANAIISLKTKIGSKLLIVSPENVAVYQGVGVTSPDVGGQAFNYFVNIINLADSHIDFYQPQAYNNWYDGFPGGSLDYLKDVYLNWRNLQGLSAWGSGPIPNFIGVKGEKLRMGLLASTSAGGAAYYAPPATIQAFRDWLKSKNYPLNGFMMWDSNWDAKNSFVVSKACAP